MRGRANLLAGFRAICVQERAPHPLLQAHPHPRDMADRHRPSLPTTPNRTTSRTSANYPRRPRRTPCERIPAPLTHPASLEPVRRVSPSASPPPFRLPLGVNFLAAPRTLTSFLATLLHNRRRPTITRTDERHGGAGHGRDADTTRGTKSGLPCCSHQRGFLLPCEGTGRHAGRRDAGFPADECHCAVKGSYSAAVGASTGYARGSMATSCAACGPGGGVQLAALFSDAV